MKKNFKLALVTFMLLATVFLATACSSEPTPYDNNDAAGYTVSIKYDANGGFFATSTSVVVDSYNISNLKAENGKVHLGLLAPDDTRRGDSDTFTAAKNGYFLAGWYTERKESTDSKGNTVYTYGKKWDFSTDTLEIDATKTYSSSEPVLTLYAAWVPMFEINFISMGTDEVVGTYSYNPLAVKEIQVPQWNANTGEIDMYRFPKKKDSTFNGAYYDAEGTQPVEGTVLHPGKIKEDGTAENHVLNIYVDWLEGEWFHIYNAEQLKDHANFKGNYILEADLDFSNETWPGTFSTSKFSGTIIGNGHVIKNVSMEQTKMDTNYMGLFGQITAEAKLENVTFENVTFTIKKGFSKGFARYGMLTGNLNDDAVLTNVQIKNSTLEIDSGVIFGSEDYAIGLICAVGDSSKITAENITCVAAGENPEKLTITVDPDGNTVTVEIA